MPSPKQWFSKLKPAVARLRAELTVSKGTARALKYAMLATGIGAVIAGSVYSFGMFFRGLYVSVAALF